MGKLRNVAGAVVLGLAGIVSGGCESQKMADCWIFDDYRDGRSGLWGGNTLAVEQYEAEMRDSYRGPLDRSLNDLNNQSQSSSSGLFLPAGY